MRYDPPSRKDSFTSLIDYLLALIVVLLLGMLILPAVATPQVNVDSQVRRAKSGEEEKISLSGAMDFDAAVELLSNMSQRFAGKLIINPVDIKGPLGLSVQNTHWIDALETILDRKGLWYEEHDDHLLIVERKNDPRLESARIATDLYTEREVELSAIFFEANITKLRELGMSWTFWNTDSTQSIANTTAEAHTGLFEITYLDQFTSVLDSARATFKALENKQAGEILASPRLVVQSGKEGRIQIGSDYTITTQDFAGNAITQFFSTGSIIIVTPTVHKVDTSTFVQVNLDIQKSAANSAGALGIEVKKTSARTSVLMLNGEETMIGGLYSNEESNTREGVPFLKDLPWWFFGLRYIFGYESTSEVRRELIILMRVDLIPTLEERIAMRRRDLMMEKEVLEDGLRSMESDLLKYKDQYKDALDKD